MLLMSQMGKCSHICTHRHLNFMISIFEQPIQNIKYLSNPIQKRLDVLSGEDNNARAWRAPGSTSVSSLQGLGVMGRTSRGTPTTWADMGRPNYLGFPHHFRLIILSLLVNIALFSTSHIKTFILAGTLPFHMILKEGPASLTNIALYRDFIENFPLYL